MLKKTMNKVTANPIGFVAGAGLTFLAMRKYAPGTKMWITAIGVIAGGVIGSNVQAMIVSKSGASKSADEAKK